MVFKKNSWWLEKYDGWLEEIFLVVGEISDGWGVSGGRKRKPLVV